MTFTEQEMWIVLFLQVSFYVKRKSGMMKIEISKLTEIVWLFLTHNESLIASKAN